jgi:hypothetical protein
MDIFNNKLRDCKKINSLVVNGGMTSEFIFLFKNLIIRTNF